MSSLSSDYPWVRIPATKDPLSADVVILKGQNEYWIYDVGNSDEVAKTINNLPGKKNIIISHFHADHLGNISKVNFDKLYVSKQTMKYSKTGTLVEAPVEITDGDLKLTILPFPSSHSKGCLGLVVNDTYLLAGDSTYPCLKDGKRMFNTTVLKEEIDFLEGVNAQFICLSHEVRFVYKKATAIKNLCYFYKKRIQGQPYIEVD